MKRLLPFILLLALIGCDNKDSDGCHPNQAGYTVMENLILPVLKK